MAILFTCIQVLTISCLSGVEACQKCEKDSSFKHTFKRTVRLNENTCYLLNRRCDGNNIPSSVSL